jgi:hypothetical protein
MKNYKKTITMLLTAAILLVSVFMTGCTKLSETPNSPPSGTDAPAESDGFGVYVNLDAMMPALSPCTAAAALQRYVKMRMVRR